MYMPFVSTHSQKVRRQIVEFGGLNRTQNVREGELADCCGISWDNWPCMGQRRGRKVVSRIAGDEASLFAHDKLYWMDGEYLRCDGRSWKLTKGKKQFAVVSNKLCIFPDKKYLDLSTMEMRDLARKVVSTEGMEAVFSDNSVTLAPDAVVETLEETLVNLRIKGSRYEEKRDAAQRFRIMTFSTVRWDPKAQWWSGEDAAEHDFIDNGARSIKGRYIILKAPAEQSAEGSDQGGGGDRPEIPGGEEVAPGDTPVLLPEDTTYPGSKRLNLKRIEEVRCWAGDGTHSKDSKEELEPYGDDNKQGLYGVIEDVKTVLSDTEKGNRMVEVTLTVKVHDATSPNAEFTGVIQPGDKVLISGCAQAANNTDPGDPLVVRQVEGRTLTFEEGTFVPSTEAGALTFLRIVPDLDFICASDNRLFGVDNATGTIYASALGDPGSFYAYKGLSTDGYAVAVSTDGKFTGCCAYSGGVLFFKEDCVHRLMGSYPAAYELYTEYIPGIQRHSERSLTLVNEVLFYKGRDGIYTYTGATPRLVSEALGNVRYEDAAAGSDGRYYYVSMRRKDSGAWELLTYDTQTGLWAKEDQRKAVDFARLDGTLYLLSEGELLALGQGEDDEGTPIPWEATFVPFDETTHDKKYPSRLLLRLELAEGAWAEVELARDGGLFQNVWTGSFGAATTVVIPIRPGRCDRCQVRLKGEGRCLVWSMAREFVLGGAR